MNELVLVVPNGDNEKLQTMLRDVRAWSHDVEARIAENANALTAENCKAEKLNAFDGEDKFLKSAADKLVVEVATATHVKEVLVEIAAARNRIKAAVKDRQDKLRKLKDANTPKAPVRAVPILLYATDAGVADLCKKIADGKVAGVEGYKLAPDEETEKKVARVLEETK